MIVSYEVGAVFRIIDNASPVLAKLFAEATRLDRLIVGITNNMANLGRASAAPLGALHANLAAATAQAHALNSALTGVAAATRGLRVPNIPGAPGGPRAPHTGTTGFSSIGLGVPLAVGHASAHLRRPGAPLIGGLVAGAGILGAMKESIEPLHQQALLRLLGLNDDAIQQVLQQAWTTTKAVPSSKIGTNIKTIGEMYSIVGLEGALQLSTGMATLDRVMGAVGKADKGEGSAYVLTRAAELMGRLTDPVSHKVDLKAFTAFLDTMSKGVIATHGKITPAEMLNYAKQAGPASGALTGEGMFTTFAIIQAMGGHRAGTASAALSRQFAGGVMTQRIAQELTRIGVAKEGDFEVRRGGQVVAKNTAMKELVDKLQADPLAAISDVLIPALEKHGFKTNEDITREIYRIIGTGPAQREVYELIRGRIQIAEERDRMRQALPAGTALQSLSQEDPNQVLKNLSASFHNFAATLGSPMMQAAIPTLNGLTSAFTNLADWAKKNPGSAATTGYTASGALIGAGLGWWFGGIGAVPGAIIGGTAGYAYGRFMTDKRDENLPPAWPAVPGPRASNLWGDDTSQAAFGAFSRQRSTVNVVVRAETDRPDVLAQAVAVKIAALLASSGEHNLGPGEGLLTSPYTSGAVGP